MAIMQREIVTQTVNAEQRDALRATVAEFDHEMLLWSSGYIAGLAEAAAPLTSAGELRTGEQRLEVGAVAANTPPAVTSHVFFATETGNSRKVAEDIERRLNGQGAVVALHDLADYRPRNLTRVENAFFIIATHGIGEAPEGSETFFDFWLSDKAPRLEKLNYSVLALGDSSYIDFCEAGRRFDARLVELGATSIAGRVECDLDFQANADRWSAEVVKQAGTDESERNHSVAHLSTVSDKVTYSRNTPFQAAIQTVQKITGRGSSKDVRHVELELTDSGISYLPGDSIGVMPENPSQLVDEIIEVTGFDSDSTVTVDDHELSLAELLHSEKEITVLSQTILKEGATAFPELQTVLSDRQQLSQYLSRNQLIDLLHNFPVFEHPQAMADLLRPLPPRMYSIASSLDANPDEAHLAVAVVRYQQHTRTHWGAASNFLVGGADEAPIFVEPNERFRLPEDGSVPIIMIGAGTGIAPYRAFLEHRKVHGHNGRNWLVYGDRQQGSDFLYQLEWLRYRKDGLLSRLDVAFSRDQAQKNYVQHKIVEHGAELYAWMQNGAHLYVCGDAEFMAPDVHTALLEVARKHGGLSGADAGDYLSQLRRERRYLRDVY